MKLLQIALSTIFVLTLLGAASPDAPFGFGSWTKSTGEEIQAPCPGVFPEEDRLRFPRGCVSQVEGVLVSKQSYVSLQGELAELKEKIKTQETLIKEQKAQIDSLRLTRVVQEVEIKPCNCSKLNSFIAGVSIGSAVTSGACLYLNR